MVLLVEPIQGVRTTFFLQVLFDGTELFTEFAIKDLVVKDILEVGPRCGTI